MIYLNRQEAVAVLEAGPLSIDQASVDRLQSLSHIGPKTAATIIEYRQAHGPFGSVDDLRRVCFIGASTVKCLRPFVSAD